MYEWFSLSFIPGAYLKQTSPGGLGYEARSSYTLPWTVNPREIFECAHLKFTVSGRSKQTYTRMCTMKSR